MTSIRALAAAALCVAAGCSAHSDKPAGPTVDAFTGRLVADGKPVKFDAADKVTLRVFTEKAESFNIPIAPDGTFKIGWMPVSKYTATLIREKATNQKGSGPAPVSLPGFTVEAGKTEYTIELGKNFKS